MSKDSKQKSEKTEGTPGAPKFSVATIKKQESVENGKRPTGEEIGQEKASKDE